LLDKKFNFPYKKEPFPKPAEFWKKLKTLEISRLNAGEMGFVGIVDLALAGSNPVQAIVYLRS
jgi:hypothetical protein